MLPTVVEESEEDLKTIEKYPLLNNLCSSTATSTRRSTTLTPLDIALCTGYPLDITHLLQQYNRQHCSKKTKPVVIITPGLPDLEVPSLARLLNMSDAVFSSEKLEGGSSAVAGQSGASDGHPVVPSTASKESGNGSVATEHKMEGNGDTSKMSDGEGKQEHQRDEGGKARKDSEGDRERRGSGNRRYRNNRTGGRRQTKDKRWWVCPDPSCRHRNSVDSSNCSNCGLVQEKRGGGGRHPYARNWEKSRVCGLASTHISSPTTLYLQTPQQQSDYARLRNCMAQSYATASYRPSLVAAKMLLGVKVGESYERVRTEERKDGDETAAADARKQQKDPAQLKDPVGSSVAAQSNGTSTAAVVSSPCKSPGGSSEHQPPSFPAPSASGSTEWRVQLVDRGSWCWVKEENLNFLLAGLSDLAPLADKYTLNELRTKRDATEEQLEQSRQWLENELKDVKVDGDVYRQNKEHSSVVYVDLYNGETLLNRTICELGSVEPKMNLRWLKPPGSVNRVSTSSVEDGPPLSPREGEELQDPVSDGENRSGSASPDTAEGPKEQRQRRREERSGSVSGNTREGESVDRSGMSRGSSPPPPRSSAPPAPAAGGDYSSSAQPNTTTGARRGGGAWWNNRRQSQDSRPGGRQQQQRRALPPLHDWAVLCFDQRTSHTELRSLCEMVEHVGKESRVSISAADSIRIENCAEDSSMGVVLADVIATHPRLLLLLCVLPNHVQDYSGLERTGRSLGVCVVCVRGDSLAVPSTSTATTLLKDLQSALLHSPAILPDQGLMSNGSQGNRRRRENRGRRSQNRQRPGASAGASRSPTRGGSGQQSDPRLQAVIGAASEGIALLQKLAHQPGGQLAQLSESSLSPGMKSLLQSPDSHLDIAKALESLDDLQGSYKQARTYTHEAFQAAGNFFSHLSNAIAPPVAAD